MSADLETEIQSGDRRRSLVALRDYLAHELGVHRCKTCEASQLRTGDTAALVLRLTKVIEEIEAIPAVSAEETPLEKLRAQRAANPLGTKNAERRSGPRRTGG